MEARTNLDITTLYHFPQLSKPMEEYLYSLTVRDLTYMNPYEYRAIIGELTLRNNGHARNSTETEVEYRIRMASAEAAARRQFREIQRENGNIDRLRGTPALTNIPLKIRQALFEE
ncbi:hypothetical protein LJC07_02695 [Christensenellaceae bacterium OttesenSCG-928-L17]|nr:hypothetical protein [Christensenellaceae bacterium OttesenSCG-928-L17]